MRKQGKQKDATATADAEREAVQQRERVETIQARLEARYGIAEWIPRYGAIDELVSCILSQHTSDLNSGRAFERLKNAYADWQAVIDAPVKELADTIRCGGLADSKAPRIQAVLRRIQAQEGSICLDCLDGLTDAEAQAYLMDLPGVGPKTAAIVLSFALGRPVIPVDTHIFRVAWRLGLIEKRIGEAKAHDALQAQVAPENVYRFHVALIRHGRQVCKAPTPRCGECPLTDLCLYYHQHSLPAARE
jgi:endonuclease III